MYAWRRRNDLPRVPWKKFTVNPDTEVQRLLCESGAVLKRTSKHEVWELPNGQNFVQAHTPSDVRAGYNNLAVLQKLLDCKPIKGTGERREPRNKPGNQSPPVVHVADMGNLGEKLLAAGAVELALRAELRRKNAELEALQKESEVNIERAVRAGVVDGVNVWTGPVKGLSEKGGILRKTCSQCAESRPVTDFQKVGQRGAQLRRMGMCQSCFSERRDARRAKKREEKAAAELAAQMFTCARCESLRPPELRSGWKKSWCKPCVSEWRKQLPSRKPKVAEPITVEPVAPLAKPVVSVPL